MMKNAAAAMMAAPAIAPTAIPAFAPPERPPPPLFSTGTAAGVLLPPEFEPCWLLPPLVAVFVGLGVPTVVGAMKSSEVTLKQGAWILKSFRLPH